MNEHIQALSNDIGQLAADARVLMEATANVPGDKVCEARKRLAAALENSKGIVGRVRDEVLKGTKVVNDSMHEHPYPAIAIGIGIGTAVGFLVARLFFCNRD